jgi:uncharacterized protein YxeA
MTTLLGIILALSIGFAMFMFKKSQVKRLNESGRYEEYVRDRREARRRARSRKRYEEQQRNEENTAGDKI